MLDGRKVLITGHTGRLGGSVATAFAQRCELWGLARYSASGQRDYWEAQGVRTVVGDYARDDLKALLPTDFDYVLHLAANTYPQTMADGLRDNAEGVGLLMSHCRAAKAFLHVSTVGVYAPNPDPHHLYSETDPLGGAQYQPVYTGSKLAGEGVAMACARMFALPTVICRLGSQYGDYADGGLPGIMLSMLEAGRPIPVATPDDAYIALVSNDDVVDFIEPSLQAASIPARIINWVGDEVTSFREVIDHLAALAGVVPQYTGNTNDWASFRVDTTERRRITGPCKVPWREGLARLHAARESRGTTSPAHA